jgi:hypothetical protein
MKCGLRHTENQGAIDKDAAFWEIVVQYGRNSLPFLEICPVGQSQTNRLSEMK